jgi:putative ABC transport system permease protein
MDVHLVRLLALLLFLAAPDPMPEILVSRTLLRDRGLRVGEVVQLSADPRGHEARPFRIAGTYEPTPDPSRFTARRFEVRMHLPDLLALRGGEGDDAVSAVNVALRDPADAESYAGELRARAPAVVVAPTRAGDDQHFRVIERFHLAISLVTVVGSTAFLLALMVIRADERREVAGLLRLLGVSRRRVLAQALFEGFCIAAAGAVFGVAFAAVTQGAVNAFFQWRYDTTLQFVRVTPAIAAWCVAVALPLGVLAGLVASWTLLRRPVLDLLRR